MADGLTEKITGAAIDFSATESTEDTEKKNE
jgi:hypothetical protein